MLDFEVNFVEIRIMHSGIKKTSKFAELTSCFIVYSL